MNGGVVDDVAQWLRDLAEIGSPAPDEPIKSTLTRFTGRQWLRLDQSFRSGSSWERPGRPAVQWRQRLTESPSLAVIGAARFGERFETTAVPELRQQAVEVVRRWLDQPASSQSLGTR